MQKTIFFGCLCAAMLAGQASFAADTPNKAPAQDKSAEPATLTTVSFKVTGMT